MQNNKEKTYYYLKDFNSVDMTNSPLENYLQFALSELTNLIEHKSFWEHFNIIFSINFQVIEEFLQGSENNTFYITHSEITESNSEVEFMYSVITKVGNEYTNYIILIEYNYETNNYSWNFDSTYFEFNPDKVITLVKYIFEQIPIQKKVANF